MQLHCIGLKCKSNIEFATNSQTLEGALTLNKGHFFNLKCILSFGEHEFNTNLEIRII